MANSTQQYTASTPTSPDRKKGTFPIRSLLFIIIIVFLVLASIASIYFFFQFQESQMKLNQANQEMNDVKNKLAVLEEKSRPTPTPVYCVGGELYENIPQVYKICYPKGWYVQATNDLKNRLTFTTSPNAIDHLITIIVSSNDTEAVLSRLAKNVYVDSTDRKYQVDNTPAIQVVGLEKPSTKKAITVFTQKGKTYEIVLTNKADATFLDYLNIYKKLLESFRFIK